MMRLPRFHWVAPESAAEAVRVLRDEGPAATVVAGGTDLYPNMKRRQVEPGTVVSLRRIEALRGIRFEDDGTLRVGAAETLRAIERHEEIGARLPALRQAVASISTPLLRNMGTIGGNLCLDTRCYYVNQSYEWRRAVNHCLKCGGETCWTAPGSTKCWAVNSSDGVPLMMALGAKFTLLGAEGERELDADEMYAVSDGREWTTRKPGELLTEIRIPPQPEGARSVYLKLRRRKSFDFPVLGVAARVVRSNGTIRKADLVLNALGPAPLRVEQAEKLLAGGPPDEAAFAAAAEAARKLAKPLQNTDYLANWRKKMVPVMVRRALEQAGAARA